MSKSIINGIDVSECLFTIIATDKTIYCRKDLDSNGTPIYKCEEIKLCYFKEIARLKKENEEIRKINNDLAETHKTIGQDLYKECVSLRSESAVQKEVAKAFCRGLEQTEKLLGKYKQALEEIREMLKKSMSLKSNAYNHFINVEKAIDKINEVLNGRD